MSSIDQQFVEFIVKSLVGNPDAVSIERRIDEKGVLLELTVDPQDLGRVIGKRGATAQSLRTLLRALGTKNDARYNLKIIDNGPDDGPRERREDSREQSEPSEQPASKDKKEKPSSDKVEAAKTEAKEEKPKPEEIDHDSVLSQTRKELAELDDLDV